MDQSYILKLIVVTSGAIAAGVVTASAIALRVLDKKTQEVKKHRLEEETRRASDPPRSGGGMVPIHH